MCSHETAGSPKGTAVASETRRANQRAMADLHCHEIAHCWLKITITLIMMMIMTSRFYALARVLGVFDTRTVSYCTQMAYVQASPLLLCLHTSPAVAAPSNMFLTWNLPAVPATAPWLPSVAHSASKDSHVWAAEQMLQVSRSRQSRL